jgi:hypothetical protein
MLERLDLCCKLLILECEGYYCWFLILYLRHTGDLFRVF